MMKKARFFLALLSAAALTAGSLSGCGAMTDTGVPADAEDSGSCEAPASDDGADLYTPEAGAVMEEEGMLLEEHNTEEYSAVTDNRFLSVKNHPLSTFAADVDTASYANMRRYVNSGELPPADAIRIEELVNYFHYDYPLPEEDRPFSCSTEVVPCPWNEDTLLMRIGVAAEPIPAEELPPQNLIFLIDVSGSMDGPDRLDLVKRAFLLFCEQLKEGDTVSIVTYASSDQIVLEGAGANERDMIMYAVETLFAGGSTNGSAGIETAYELAEKYRTPEGNNRIILATDGDLNLGVTSEGDLKRLVEEKRDTGIFLSVMGFGSGNLKDNKLETLADNGNGNYTYIDSIVQARKALVEEMGATLHTVAKDVKLQVEFNPRTLKGYRLIGYENRLMAAEDFADDTKDGGELGAGHQVTALYELVPLDSPMEMDEADLRYQEEPDVSDSEDFCTVSIRYKEPSGSESTQFDVPVTGQVSESPSPSTFLASLVAQTGMLLRDSPYSGTSDYDGILEQLEQLDEEIKSPYTDELEDLVRRMKHLKRMGSNPEY